MTLRLTNTLTRRTEPFTLLTPGKASIYCCGVTVYDLCHLGHARSYIIRDVLRRFLIWRGLDVTFVQISRTSTTRSSSAPARRTPQ